MQRRFALEDLDEIRLENLEVACVVGIYPREKLVPQPVIVNLRLFLDTRQAGRQVSLRESIDYAAVAGEIRFVLEHSHFRLLETAADALSHLLLAPAAPDQPRARPEAIELELKKPAAIGGGAVASVKVRRWRNDVKMAATNRPIGAIDILHQSADCTLYRLIIRAGEETPAFLHTQGEVAEIALSEGLLVQGQPLSPGEGHVWPHQFPRRYVNPTRMDRALLAVARGGLDQFSPFDANGVLLRELPRECHRMYYPGAEWTSPSVPLN